MNKWGCSKSTQRDLQQIKSNTQEEYSKRNTPTRAGKVRIIPVLISVPFSIE
jgi:hypothetical protein